MMRALLLSCLAAGSVSLAQAQTAGPSALIRRAVTAAGGEQALRGLSAVAIDFISASYGLGQEETPLSPPRGPVASGRIVTDWRGGRRVTVQELRPVAGGVQRQRQVVAGGIGMNEINGLQAPLAPGAVAGALQAMRLQPDRLLLRALDAPGALSALPARTWRGELMDGVRFAAGGDTLALYFDRGNGLLTVSEALSDDPILGDRRTVTWYTRWQDAGGVRLPRQFDTHVNGRALSYNVVTALTPNPPLPDSLFAIPDSIARRAQPLPAAPPPPPAITVTLAELAPGVWRAEGGSHHSLVVDQGSQLVVVEAPQSRARFGAVLDTLRARFPGRRIGLVANTHHHWDHAGGVRTALAAGLRVATHRRNVAFVRGIGAAPKTVQPDALSRRPAPPLVVVAVGDSLVVGTGASRVVLYELPSAHAEGILAAYLPGPRILFASDVLSPPAAGSSAPLAALGSAELVAMVRRRGISVDRFAGGHGGIVAWSEVERAAGPR
jgi:glyoxylase-like metal-dependent hydrolase (beta-lactamase superfamily II)